MESSFHYALNMNASFRVVLEKVQGSVSLKTLKEYVSAVRRRTCIHLP